LSVSAAAWGVAITVFLALRLAVLTQAPVSGPELDSLSGAWLASVGEDDSRFLGTIFQALSSILLELDDSDTLPRLLAFLATGTVPISFWLCRKQLGEGGAILGMLVLAVDPTALFLGATAWQAAHDQALAAFILVVALKGTHSRSVLAAVGFGVATGGTLALGISLSIAAGHLLAGASLRSRSAVSVAAGIAAGVAVSSLGFGLVSTELRVPPFDLMNQGLESSWSTMTTVEILTLYELPVILAGAAAATYRATQWYTGHPPDRADRVLLGWAAFGLAHVIVARNSGDPSAILALVFPLTAIIGRAAAEIALEADLSWLRRPEDGRVARSAGTVGAAVIGSAALLVLVSGTFNIARGSSGEPLLSPGSPPGSSALRATVLALAADTDRDIVIHPSLREDTTWPLRGMGAVIVASRFSELEAVVIWPTDEDTPPGYARSVKEADLVRRVEPPEGGLNGIIDWFRDRNRVNTNGVQVAVYTGQTP
ncbi:MAG TPA: hypothetical protein QGF35_01065, partial [Dehalococcoidia bacterium]|nr:hypothetical protein [Dehalococcoidia bacterium]